MRYTQSQWNEIYSRSCSRLQSMLADKMPEVMIRNEARMLLNSCYGGSWKAIFGLIRYELKSVWGDLKFRVSESERAKVFRRIPSPAEEIAERLIDEEIALNEMAKQL